MSSVRSFHCLILSFSAAFLFALLSFSPASAATITVTSTADSGAGSLRDAIAAASAGDTIDFNLPSPSTITLTSGYLNINKNLTITGPGATSLTISGNHTLEVFYVLAGTVNISGLTITAGNAFQGGGIFNIGALTLTNVTFSGNSAAGGGGIFNIGSTLTLTNVTLSGNSATAGGGGIANRGPMIMTNCTLSGNSASIGGGGILEGGASTLTNVTLSGNSTAGQGGAIYNLTGSISLRNTIVANSISGGNCSGTITSLGHNLDSANTCGFAGPGDLINTDPMLGPLALNAPGRTETMALLAGSPAINAADPVTFPSTDQRGVTRPQGGAPDIGAYEYLPQVPAMSGWGMILFILLVGLASVSYLKRRRRAEG
jgi:predicted outer membrane repeat protein